MPPISPVSPRHPVPASVTRAALDYDSDDASIPHEAKCPITRGLMLHPVCLADGTTCDAQAARDWFDSHAVGNRVLGPITNRPLAHRYMAPNLALISMLHAHFPRAAALRQQRLSTEPATEPARIQDVQPPRRVEAEGLLLPRCIWLVGALVGGCIGLMGGDVLGRVHNDAFGPADSPWGPRLFASVCAAWMGTLGAIMMDRANMNDVAVAGRAAKLMLHPLLGFGGAITVATLGGIWGTPAENDRGLETMKCLVKQQSWSCFDDGARVIAKAVYAAWGSGVVLYALGTLRGMLLPEGEG